MQTKLVFASFCTLISAAQFKAPLLPRQFTNSTTPTVDPNSQPTFGAAAAAIQSAAAIGQAIKASAAAAAAALVEQSTTAAVSTTSLVTSTISTSTTSTETPISTTQRTTDTIVVPATRPVFVTTVIPSTLLLATVQPVAPTTVAPSVLSSPTSTTPVTTPASGYSVGSQGTTTVDGDLYTTVVVASYVTVAAQPTTFYENGIAYVASYAGETITVTDCPCTRSARIAVMTTTICSACVDGSAVSATQTGLPVSEATSSTGDAVVFTGSARGRTSHAQGMIGLIVASLVTLSASLLI